MHASIIWCGVFCPLPTDASIMRRVGYFPHVIKMINKE